MSKIGKLIRKKRFDKKISQVKLGDHLRYTSQYIANWERGASSPPLNKIKQICRLLDIPMESARKAVLDDYKEKLDAHLR